MRIYTLIISALCLKGCGNENRITYYCFDNICFTKVNNSSGNTDFYFGKILHEKDLPDNGVKCEYYGFSNGMQAYFMFKPDSTICIVPLMGKFEPFGNSDKHLQICDMTNTKFRKWQDSILGKYNNVVFISDISEVEINQNKENNSNVTILR